MKSSELGIRRNFGQLLLAILRYTIGRFKCGSTPTLAHDLLTRKPRLSRAMAEVLEGAANSLTNAGSGFNHVDDITGECIARACEPHFTRGFSQMPRTHSLAHAGA